MGATSAPQRLLQLWETPHSLWGHLATVDHKIVGKRYLVTAFIFLLMGGVEALLMRVQLTHSNNTFLSPEGYDQLFSMRGITMIFWYAAPILSGFGNYLIPLMLGARETSPVRSRSALLFMRPLSGTAPSGIGLSVSAAPAACVSVTDPMNSI
ncbi:MAG TPA: cbb3-type cytochrome c oxidase subunit I, partial [Steroidobacteraceae bacterium]|nr:cbb3-type cytochrome c oxidase subunit I [Steroidobacteraceae bacterium]